MEFVELSESEFSKFVNSSEQANFMQTVGLGNLKKAYKHNVYYVGVKEKNKVICATLLDEMPAVLGKKIFYSARGFIIDYHNKKLLSFFTEEIKKFIKKHNGFKLIIDPNVLYRLREANGDLLVYDNPDDETINNLKELGYIHFGFNNMLEAIQVRFAYRLELNEPYEEKLKLFSKSTRKNIESSYKKGLRVRLGNEKDLESMQDLFEDTAKKKDFFFRTLDYYKKMYDNMKELMTIYIAYVDPDVYYDSTKELYDEEVINNENINKKMKTDMVGSKLKNQKEVSDKLLIKYKDELDKASKFKEDYPDGKDIACLLSLRSGNEYLTLTSGSLAEFHYFTPKYMMYDYHIKDAYKYKFKYCNFYGISGIFTKENNPLYGVYEFKRGFGGNVMEYIGEFSLAITSFNTVYNVLSKVKKIIKR